MTCGSCGSGISAQEKVKRQKNGNVHHYTYYGCSRSRDKQCKEPYLREENLTQQICSFIDQLEVSRLGIQKKIEDEIDRFTAFQEITNENHTVIKAKDVDIKNYLKYLLQNGSVIEKREILMNLKTRIILRSKKLEAT